MPDMPRLNPFSGSVQPLGGLSLTVNRTDPALASGFRYFVCPFLVDRIKELRRGICLLQAGFGHFTVRAQSQAITVSSSPSYSLRSLRSLTISLVILILG